MSNIDDELKNAVLAVAKAKVASAMSDDLLGELVASVMKHKESGFNREGDKTFIEKTVEIGITRAIEQAVNEFLKEKSDLIKVAVKAAMEKKADEFATEILDAFAKDDWRATLDIKIHED